MRRFHAWGVYPGAAPLECCWGGVTKTAAAERLLYAQCLSCMVLISCSSRSDFWGPLNSACALSLHGAISMCVSPGDVTAEAWTVDQDGDFYRFLP